MTTLIFVHGTGVREKRYVEQYELIRTQAVVHWGDIDTRPCLWGDKLGVRIDAAAAAVPDYDLAGGSRLPIDGWRDERWILLEADPLYELRLIEATYRERDVVVLPGQESGSDRVERYLMLSTTMGMAVGLAETLEQVRVPRDTFTAGVRAVFDSAAAQHAIHATGGTIDGDGELREALARAVVAATLVAADDGEPGAFPLDAIGRDLFTFAVLDELHGSDLGLGKRLLQVSGELMLRMGVAGTIERRRGMIMDGVTPFAGDILRYLAHGEAVRRFIAETVRSVPGPVVLLGHSLGGIACLDLLHLGLARVDLLITAGSQVAYLQSLGALPSSPTGAMTTDRLPKWINVYDPRDLLAYIAEPVFGSAVTDLAVASGVPFPRAHSAYFTNREFYEQLRDKLPR
ncbi:alpha/beta fold hydrolase [Micromonospora arborensis]|uniref:alpha/beta fold hydrolase n=1 Tax=Micromonospora arborensis TaxID=2116518 RepID=UPI003422FBB8